MLAVAVSEWHQSTKKDIGAANLWLCAATGRFKVPDEWRRDRTV